MNKKQFGWVIGLVLLLIVLIYIAGYWGDKRTNGTKKFNVGIFQIARHPVLDMIPLGFREILDLKFPGQIHYETMIPEGDPGKIEQMAKMFATQKYDLVFVIGTNCAQSLAKKTATIPIVLGAATDPLTSGLIDDWERPGRNVTGTSDLSPVGIQLDRIRELIPEVKRIGAVYNPSEDNSKSLMERLKIECSKRNLVPVLVTVSSQNEMKQTVVSLKGKVDTLYAPTDATVQTAFDVLIKTATELKLPVFNCDEGTVKKGALFSVGFNYLDIGKTSGEMAAKILKGEAKPETMPIQFVGQNALFYNQKQIDFFGFKVPASWIRDGKRIDH